MCSAASRQRQTRDLGKVTGRGGGVRSGFSVVTSRLSAEELEQQAKSLKGATMPDGQKDEDWLKSKDREEDIGRR
jgi:hypothetical protein